MRENRIFNINDQDLELPLFQAGDRVQANQSFLGLQPVGTVDRTEHGGLFVFVNWDEETCINDKGASITFGSSRMVNSIVLLQEDDNDDN